MTRTSLASGRLLAGHVALVTGAAGGIGAAVASTFRDQGAIVHGFDLRPAPDVVLCDVTSEDAVAAAFDATSGVSDIVHAAGSTFVGSVREMDTREWREVIDVNLTSGFLVGREAARRLQRGGTITFIASQAGIRGGALWSAYSAAKAGILRLGESLAEELGDSEIRVNSVCPGSVNTAMLSRTIDSIATQEHVTAADVRARYLDGIPLGRFAEPHEVASVCVFLSSGLASYISGTSLIVDGGELT